MSSSNGQKRTRVAVQANTPSADSLGQLQPSWATVATLWGYDRPATGREMTIASQQNATVSRIVETRWPGSLVTVTPLHRLLVNGAVYNVTWVNNVAGRNKYLYIGCIERAEPTGD